MKPVFHNLSIKEIRRETPDCVSIQFDVPKELAEAYDFKAGQYLTLKTNIGDQEVRRSYSICSAPNENSLRVAVKQVEGGLFSTLANQKLQAEDSLGVMTPMGKFTLPDSLEAGGHYVAFAAGSGITPVLSIMKTVLSQDSESNFTLFFGNRSFDSIIFREEIEAMKNKYIGRLSVHHILSREDLGSELFSGRIDGEKCGAFCKLLFDPQQVAGYYLCGPEEMIFSVKDKLIEIGVEDDRVHFELFTAPGAAKAKVITEKDSEHIDPTLESLVTITLDQKSFDMRLPYGGNNILDAALNLGADLPYACKGGVCCTCRARLVEGEVEMTVNYALEPDEVDDGFILTCQSHPRTPKLHVNFDEK